MKTARNSARSDFVRLGLERPLLSRTQEKEHFLRMRSLVTRADELQARIDRGDASPAMIERVEALRAEANNVRNQIVEANLRLVVSVAAKFASRETPLNELVSECLPPLMRAVELFDVDQGNNFSTYATHAVRNAIGRALQRGARGRERMVSTEPGVMDARPGAANEDPADPVRWTKLAGRALGLLTPRERTILAARFGLDGFSHEHTFREIGGMLGLSKERARVLAHQSIETLREHFTEEDLDG